MKGKFIVFEGCDKSGKSTQCKMLSESMKNNLRLSFPERDSLIGSIIDSYLKKEITYDNPTVIELLFKANRLEFQGKIKESLDKGINVVCDRYFYSGLAYNYAKKAIADPENPIDIVQDMEYSVDYDKSLIHPDYIFYIVRDSNKRKDDFDNEIYDSLPFQRKVQEAFDTMFACEQKLSFISSQKTKIVKLHNDSTIENLNDKIISILNEIV